ncbi:MAG: DUF2029 domain-containing protein [Anaerolineales bacterium]|nr:DUF2029 domain-containing protein [Anaerolineales bacterium]
MIIVEMDAAGDSRQMKTILTLFIAARLTILFFYSPQGLLNAYTDYYYYYRTAQLSEQGYYPFVNMWYEYPPITAYLPQAAYGLTRQALPPGDVYSFSYQFFARLLGVILLVFDTGVLVLLQAIAARVWGQARAIHLAWVYAALSLPLLFWTYSHQAVAVFFLLLAIYLFLEGRPLGSAAALGLGIAAKITPVFLLAPALKFTWPQRGRAAAYGLVAGIVPLLTYLPFTLLGGWSWIAASFTAMARVGSYGTLWAMIDQNWGPGDYGPLETRLQLDQAGVIQANPSVIPGVLILGVFALLYALVYFRPVDRSDPRHFIWFTTLTMIIFHLWSKGWSPQWVVMIIPLVLLSFPAGGGLRWVLWFTALILVEWLFSALTQAPVMASIFILLRTLLLVWIGWVLVRRLWSPGRLGQLS